MCIYYAVFKNWTRTPFFHEDKINKVYFLKYVNLVVNIEKYQFLLKESISYSTIAVNDCIGILHIAI